MKAVSPEYVKTGCLVLGIFSDDDGSDMTASARSVDRAARGALRTFLRQGDLPSRAGATLLWHRPAGIAAERILFVSLGPSVEFGVQPFRDAVRGTAAALQELGAKSAVISLAEVRVGERAFAWKIRQIVLGIRERFYRFDELKSQKRSRTPALASVMIGLPAGLPEARAQSALVEAIATADGTDLARTLGNLPPNICTPAHLADEAKLLAKRYRLTVQILERRDMERLGMGALLAVTRGSHQPPKMIILRYEGGPKRAKPVVLVGKGITFDTGGISLKPGAEMDEMKFDMSGAGSVLGALRALAAMKAPVNVIGVIPACENMPGGSATRPGDIVKTLSGQTVEILNTDAEGRLILCDALTYSERFAPDVVVNVATLTGACVIALGHVATGLFANDQILADELREAGDDAWDRVWQMPLWDEYHEQLRSNFADTANIGGRPAGSITAACYLSRFTKTMRWAHLDIAGTAWRSGREKGSTGRPVPLLVRFVLRHAGKG